MKAFAGFFVLVTLLVGSPWAQASDAIDGAINMIEIGSEAEELIVPVAPDSEETASVTPVIIARDEAGRIVSVETAEEGKDLGYLFGIQYGRPLRVSLSAGLVIGKWNGAGVQGWLVEVEAGLAGGAVSVGMGMAGDPISQTSAITVLHTWGDPLYTESGATYIGFRQTIQFLVKITMGYMYRLAGPEEAGKWMAVFSAGIGIGDIWERGEKRRR